MKKQLTSKHSAPKAFLGSQDSGTIFLCALPTPAPPKTKNHPQVLEILSDLLQEAEVKLLAEAKVFEVEMRELKLRLADEEMKLALG